MNPTNYRLGRSKLFLRSTLSIVLLKHSGGFDRVIHDGREDTRELLQAW